MRFPHILLSLLVCLNPFVFAQVDRATLSGVVTDPSGATMANASISLEASATGFHRATTTASDGSYRLPGLPVGNYAVTVSKEGFRPSKIENVTLTVGQTRTLDAQLSVGAVTTAVEVAAAATPLDQTNAEIGSVIGEQQIRNIPLNGRHWASLMQLAPGAVNAGDGNQNSIRLGVLFSRRQQLDL